MKFKILKTIILLLTIIQFFQSSKVSKSNTKNTKTFRITKLVIIPNRFNELGDDARYRDEKSSQEKATNLQYLLKKWMDYGNAEITVDLQPDHALTFSISKSEDGEQFNNYFG